MKRLLLGYLFILCTASSFAQKEVYLKINHKLGDQAFAFNTSANSVDGQKFNLRRLEYYLSNIILVHDGGQMIKLTDTYLLVNGNATVNTNLGNFDITDLEEIRFAVGVNAEVNHNDPASWPPSHPLYPKSPSMHWGWIAGYRFVAWEGQSGTSLNQNMEIHALSDENYLQQIIPTTGTLDGNTLTIELNADYTQALKGIDVSQGVVNHSNEEEAAVIMLNFAQHVFTSSEGNKAALNVRKADKINALVYPNPSKGAAMLSLPDEGSTYHVNIYTLDGKSVKSFFTDESQLELNQLGAGTYFISIQSEAGTSGSLTWINQ
ncbi:MAG: T9SS type A sorting domain-containing protein [Bacteroidota bacterium]|nr:T9SS type A sorting domain-containing protein [Bacteroidota bacterium]MDX5430640.1 T9SS type A sorting domain-containing protein [Bacteroidota bacterium]MDX5469390.1 T9SS type A sorting domain-containing protein [Bacteroidota bacterium]